MKKWISGLGKKEKSILVLTLYTGRLLGNAIEIFTNLAIGIGDAKIEAIKAVRLAQENPPTESRRSYVALQVKILVLYV